MVGYGTVMLLLQNQQPWFLLRHKYSTFFVLEQSIPQLDFLKLLAILKLPKQFLCFRVFHAPFSYLPSLVSFSLELPAYLVHFDNIVMSWLVDQVYIHKYQSIMPSQLLYTHLLLGLKILQGHIVHVDLGLMQFQVILPSLQAIQDCKEFFLMDWPPSFGALQILLSEAICLVSCISLFPVAKSLTSMCTSKGLSNLGHFSTKGEDNLFLNSSKAWLQHSFQTWITFLLSKSGKGLENLEKLHMKKQS